MRTLKIFMSAILLLLVSSGCSFWSQEKETAPAGDTDGGVLRVWVAGEQRSITAFSKFTAATGIKVQAEFAPQTEWTEKVLMNKGDPEADLFWSDNTIDMSVLAGLGVFEAYESPLAAVLPGYGKDGDGRWYGLTERQLAIIYSPSAIDDHVPTTVGQFSDATWQSQIAGPPATSRLWHRILAELAAFEGEDALQEWVGEVSPRHLDETDYSIHDMRHVAEGTIPILFSTSEAAIQYMMDQQPESQAIRIQPLRSKDGREMTIVTGIGILRGTESLQAAEALVDFLLAEENRREIAEQRTHHPLPIKEKINGSSANRLHPDEIVDLLPLIEHYWQASGEGAS